MVNRDFTETVILPASLNQLVETFILERPSRLMNIKKIKKARASPIEPACALRPTTATCVVTVGARSVAPVPGSVALVAGSTTGTYAPR